MGWLREYTLQVVFVAMQSVVIVYGVLAVATMLKMAGYPEDQNFSREILFIRHAGILFFFIPAAWVWLTIWYEGSDHMFSTVFTVGSGILVSVALFLYLNLMAMKAHRMRDYSFDGHNSVPQTGKVFRNVMQTDEPLKSA